MLRKTASMTLIPSPQSFARWRAAISRTALAMWTAETVAIALCGAGAAAASLAFVGGVRGVAGAGLALLMAAIAAVDLRRFIIPDELTVAALAIGLMYVAFDEFGPPLYAFGGAVLRGVVTGLLFFGLRELYRRLRGREGIGLGDVKLAGVAGVWLDWSIIPIAIEIAALAAIGAYLVRHVGSGRAMRPGMRLPFGLFLAPAIWVGWFLEAALLL
jgi:leader peptidase (prepilin peptidase)/N-methyltransferase